MLADDGSRDTTTLLCRELGSHLISLLANLDLARAFQTSMKYAHRHNCGYVIQFDADGQASAAYIDDMTKIAETSVATMCKTPISCATNAGAGFQIPWSLKTVLRYR